jgi:hypothetical protein
LYASLFCLVSFLLLVHIGYEYKSSNTNEIILEGGKVDALQKADSAIKIVNREINSTISLAEGIAKDLSSGKLKKDSILQERLLAETKNHTHITSIVVAYSPATNASKLYALISRETVQKSYMLRSHMTTQKIVNKPHGTMMPLKKDQKNGFHLISGLQTAVIR